MTRWLVLLLVLSSAPARAQVGSGAPPAGDVLLPQKLDDARCLDVDTTPGALLEAASTESGPSTPMPWSEFVVEGELIEPSATVHALFEPTLQQYGTSLTAKSWPDIAALTAKYGYQLTSHRLDGTRLVLQVAPLPTVRNVRVDAHQGWFDRPLDDEIRRRMRFRTDVPLPLDPLRQACALVEEGNRIDDYLHEQGYFDAVATVTARHDGTRVTLFVDVRLKEPYYLGKTTIVPGPNQLAISDAEIRAQFVHKRCLPAVNWPCLSPAPFNRTRYQEDLQKLVELFQRRGYPSVRIQSMAASDLRTAFDRRTHLVNPTLVIDQRRHIDVAFVGIDNESIKEEQLLQQLTFGQARSADDVEANNSARAIQNYLQSRGYFDARVTWTRVRFDIFDRVTFSVEPGKHRDVAAVEFVGTHALDARQLAGIVSVKPANLARDLLGTNTNATSEQLSTDVDRIVQAYRRAGYRDARVSVSASPDAAGLDDPAMTAALLSLEHIGEIYVRYTIDEGKPTVLRQIVVEHADKGKTLDPALCKQVIGELSAELSLRLKAQGCTAAIDIPFREDDVVATRDNLREFLFKKGRPRAVVDYTTVPTGDHEVAAHYAIRGLDQPKLGHIIIRGNFRTRSSVIRGELAETSPRFAEGQPLTADGLADAARRLRATSLFSAVNIDLPDVATDSSVVNAIVRVEERYDYLAQLEAGAGYSSYTHEFVSLTATDANIAGRGISLQVSGTYGGKLKDLESTLRFPQWLLHHTFTTDITGRYTEQDTPRFGKLTTKGFSTSFIHQWITPRSANVEPDTKLFGLRYDFRVRSRNVDALRPIGVDMDDSQVAVSTTTSLPSLLFVWDHRLDRNGQLAPLAPEAGFRLEASAAFAEPWLLGQDEFIKLSAAASKFFAIGSNLTLRGDLRYDQGIPLGGAALLPEVERFFAGGDTTVRGYEDDRLATEIVRVGVPPIAGLSQIRVIPSGGNIRTLASVDAQLRIYKILAGALFSDAGLITNQWASVTLDSIRPSVGTGLRLLTPFGILAVEYAVPLRPHLGDDPRGRLHFYFAARAQF